MTQFPHPAPGPRLMTAAPAPGARPFFGRVESLRGLGALAVAAYHISGRPVHGVPLWPDRPWAGVGAVQNVLPRLGLVIFPAHAALMVFFVISGFVLRLSLGHGPQRLPTATGKFFLGRIFRIFPVVMVAVLLAALVPACQAPLHGQAPRPLTAPSLVANLLLCDVSLNNTFWALQVELLMAPVIVLLFFLERGCGPRAVLAVALGTTALAYVHGWALWPALSANVFPFVLGMLVPTLGRHFALGISRRTAALAAGGAATALALAGSWLGLYSRQSAVIEAYAAFVLVCLVAYRVDVAALRALDARPLRWLGQASGSYYVLHMATVTAALVVASALVAPAWMAHVPGVVGPLVVVAWLGALVPLAVCSYHVIEAPGIALGRRVIGLCRLDAPRVTAPAQRRGEGSQVHKAAA